MHLEEEGWLELACKRLGERDVDHMLQAKSHTHARFLEGNAHPVG